jgi:hypothetical protein
MPQLHGLNVSDKLTIFKEPVELGKVIVVEHVPKLLDQLAFVVVCVRESNQHVNHAPKYKAQIETLQNYTHILNICQKR